MHFFVAGATGRVGRAFVDQACAAGHSVTALVRNPERSAQLAEGAEVVVGDVLDRASLERAMTSDHVVVSALGGGPPTAPGSALSVGTSNLVAIASACNVSRILAVVGAGVLQADADHLRSERPDYPPFLRPIGAEHMGVYRALRDGALDWTLACTPNIVDGPPTGRCLVKADYLPDGAGRVTTGDVAAFLLGGSVHASFPRSRVGLNTPD